MGKELVHPKFVLPQVVRVQVLRPLGRCIHDLPEDGLFRVIRVLLFQKSNADILEKQHLSAAVRGIFPRQDPEQGSLARTVGGDERHLVAFIDVEVDMLE